MIVPLLKPYRMAINKFFLNKNTMKVKIDKIENHGKEGEKIVLEVLEDTNLGDFLILDTTYSSSGKISNKVRHPYWFPNKEVKKGDSVTLFTKEGKNISLKMKNSKSIYFFYWNLKSFVWNNDGDCALLVHVKDCESYQVRI